MGACVVWVGRHEIIPSERRFLDTVLGEYQRVRVKFVSTAEDLVESVVSKLRGSCDRIVVTGTMPLSVYARLAELQDTHGFEVWYPVMVEVDRPPFDVEQCYRGGRCKRYRFKAFMRLRRVELVLEPVESWGSRGGEGVSNRIEA